MGAEHYGPAQGYGFISRVEEATGSWPLDIIKVDLGDGVSYVPVFTNPDVAGEWTSRLDKSGPKTEIRAARTGDELASLLTDLKSIGVTHVAFDTLPGTAPDIIPIDRAIIGFSVHG
jgi:hypothetical protein